MKCFSNSHYRDERFECVEKSFFVGLIEQSYQPGVLYDLKGLVICVTYGKIIET